MKNHVHRVPISLGGFTLLELVVTVTVLTVVLTFGVPNFWNAIQNSRSTAQANDLITAFNLARSEAIRRGLRVTVCPSTDGEQCGSGWEGGWMVFVDGAANDDATPSVVGEPLRLWSALGGDPTFTNAPDWVRYLPQGNLRTSESANEEWSLTMTMTPERCHHDQAREIAFRAGGRVAARRASC